MVQDLFKEKEGMQRELDRYEKLFRNSEEVIVSILLLFVGQDIQ